MQQEDANVSHRDTDTSRFSARSATLTVSDLFKFTMLASLLAILADAVLSMTVQNRNTHRAPLPPQDEVNLHAVVPSGDAQNRIYEIQASAPMVSEPRGRFTTWEGVGLDVWHHGRSGIGTPRLPAMRSDVAVYAIGTIWADDQIVASGVPVHAMTSARDGARLELDVGDLDFPIPGVAEGHLRATWAEYDSNYTRRGDYAKYGFGSGVLIILLGFVMAAVHRQTRDTP